MIELIRNFVIMFASLIGILIGYHIAPAYQQYFDSSNYQMWIAILFGSTFYLLVSVAFRYFENLISKLIFKISPKLLFYSLILLISGALVGYFFVGFPISLFLKLETNIDWMNALISFSKSFLPILSALFFAYLFLVFGYKMRFNYYTNIAPKVADTSVLMEEVFWNLRFLGLIEGQILIPGMVLKELQYLADTNKQNKRKRALYALDNIHKFKFHIFETSLENVDADEEIIKIAQLTNAVVLTNDVALEKIALDKDINVINLKKIYNFVNNVNIGDIITVEPVKRGKEKNQFVAYLDNGDMVVIFSKKDIIGKKVFVKLNHITKSEVGKIFFGKEVGGEENEGKRNSK